MRDVFVHTTAGAAVLLKKTADMTSGTSDSTPAMTAIIV
jgi:hypothetical protein